MKVRSIGDLAAALKGRRQELGWSQAQLANRAVVSRKWVYEFESGKPTAELGHVLRVADALGLELELRPTGEGGIRKHGSIDLDLVFEQLRDRDTGGQDE